MRAFMIHETGLGQIVELLAYVRDEEAQANCAKVVRVCLREDLVSIVAYNFFLEPRHDHDDLPIFRRFATEELRYFYLRRACFARTSGLFQEFHTYP